MKRNWVIIGVDSRKPKTSIFKDWKLAGSANLAKADFLGFLVQIKTVTQ